MFVKLTLVLSNIVKFVFKKIINNLFVNIINVIEEKVFMLEGLQSLWELSVNLT